MVALKSDPDRPNAKTLRDDTSPLARVMREFEDLVLRFETGLLHSLDPRHKGWLRDDIRQEACRLAIAELGATYTRREIRRSLHDAESQGRHAEQQLHAAVAAAAAAHMDTGIAAGVPVGAGARHTAATTTTHGADDEEDTDDTDDTDELRAIHHGYFRLYSTELFDLLGQPTDLRLGTVRFHHDVNARPHPSLQESRPVSVELALGSSFFVAESLETLPYHAFKVPSTPSLQNRGILSRKPEDNGAFPDFDSWLLFTFLGNGCLKLEVPIEMCADVYGGPLIGRENEEIHFWGVFVDDDAP